MVKKTLKQIEKEEEKDKLFIGSMRSKIKADWGDKCDDHAEECVICNAYKALNELERLYGFEESN